MGWDGIAPAQKHRHATSGRADLTRSTLSLADLMARIEGRHALPAHGASAMPVWGEVFDERLVAEPKAHEIIALRIRALAEHVRSLREHS